MASIYSANIYNQLLADISRVKSIRGSNLDDYLVNFRPVATKLYKSLLNEEVEVNYEDTDIQIAYALRYFPVYWEQIFTALTKVYLAKDFNNINSFNIGLFGSGPCPEIIGIIRFIESLLANTIGDLNKKIYALPKIIHSYDQANSTWRFSKETFIHPSTRYRAIVDLGFTMASGNFDFTANLKLPQKFQNNFYNVCCFQNCLNEFRHLSTDNTFKSNLLSVISSIDQTGFLIITDREYQNSLSSAKKAANEIIGICLSNGMVLNSAIEGSDSWYSNKEDSPLQRMMRSLFTFNEFERLITTFVNRRFIYILQKK